MTTWIARAAEKLWAPVAYKFDLLACVNKLVEDSNGKPVNRDALNLLYKFLDVIDSKASTLLRFDGIILAVLAVLSRTATEGSVKPFVYLFTILVLIVSCALCMFVVQISWGFLAQGAHEVAGFDPAVEFPRLCRAVAFRHRCYYVAWYITALCGVVLFLMISWEFNTLFGRTASFHL